MAQVGAAWETVREKGLLWPSVDGVYALEDIAMRDRPKFAGLLSGATRHVSPLLPGPTERAIPYGESHTGRPDRRALPLRVGGWHGRMNRVCILRAVRNL